MNSRHQPIEFGLVVILDGRHLAFRAGVVEQPVDASEALQAAAMALWDKQEFALN